MHYPKFEEKQTNKHKPKTLMCFHRKELTQTEIFDRSVEGYFAMYTCTL